MSVQPTDDGIYVTLGIDAIDMLRYADISLENGEVLIYDRDEEDAWFQSDSAVGLEAMT